MHRMMQAFKLEHVLIVDEFTNRLISNYTILLTAVSLVRGVQYVHWVMHKCIMVKVGGKVHVKYVKSRRIWLKQEGTICKSRGERIIFAKQGWKCTETAKIGGKFKICGQ